MAVYSYTALKDGKEVVKGKIDADSITQARANIRRLGFMPLKVFKETSSSQETKTENNDVKLEIS